MNNKSFFKKIIFLVKTIKNWPLVIIDKMGLQKLFIYKTYDNLTFICRSKTTDINEIVVILANLEYPEKYIKIEHSNAVILDIGANIGAFTVYFNQINNAINYKGFAIEPFNKNFSLLQKNCHLNKVNNFSLICAAISDIDGIVNIETNCQPDAISITNSNTGVEVRSFRLSTFCKKSKITNIELIKMDIEGKEYDVIESDYEFILKNVNKLLIECHKVSNTKNLDWVINKFKNDFFIEIIRGNLKNGGVIFAKNKKTINENIKLNHL